MKNPLVFLFPTVVLLLLLFVFFDVPLTNMFILTSRLQRVLALVLISAAIAYATLVFQTIANNKILTPSLMGYEHLFVLLQLALLILFGGNSQFFQSKVLSFLLSTAVMILYSFVLYFGLFRSRKKQIYYILLIGLVLGVFFNTSTQFLQMTIDPNNFAYVQNAMFSSIGRISLETLMLASFLMVLVFIYLARYRNVLDILSLGRSYALGLGVEYDKVVQKQLLGISILVSISTALIGPITFVGIFVSGITYQISKTEKHRINLIIAFAVCMILMISAQFLIEHALNYKHNLSVLINLLGGLYFLILILKLLRK
ncbi:MULTISPECIES: iron chelate uptake ABC transporter family permease subunit [Sphingobacterium]|uniref:Iron ABC transporter permease n=1 Tax=Sphingobacterium athyrii TaxID=2152717 RepID=A0A363NT95_9SPHI|nr:MULTISPECIES: iron chelate uptake ABC transporter family permease subunit [Sphingobacterium]PUV23994.1 iron ABC transporter permease [Sphingobacterium athyrii]QIH34238.1 iron chelate uptake ABC transporter family permease subunit [Sphingobacterium sp. DR205]